MTFLGVGQVAKVQQLYPPHANLAVLFSSHISARRAEPRVRGTVLVMMKVYRYVGFHPQIFHSWNLNCLIILTCWSVGRVVFSWVPIRCCLAVGNGVFTWVPIMYCLTDDLYIYTLNSF